MTRNGVVSNHLDRNMTKLIANQQFWRKRAAAFFTFKILKKKICCDRQVPIILRKLFVCFYFVEEGTGLV